MIINTAVDRLTAAGYTVTNNQHGWLVEKGEMKMQCSSGEELRNLARLCSSVRVEGAYA